MSKTTETTSLTSWLEVQIAADEAAARGVEPAWHSDPFSMRFSSWESDHSVGDSAFVDAFDPARVLRQCAALRAVVALHDPCDDWSFGDASGCPTLRALASIYADRPGWQEAWA